MLLISLLACSLPVMVFSSEARNHFKNVPMGNVVGSIEKTCRERSGATIDELILLHNIKHLSSTRESKCMMACTLDLYGVFDDEGVPIVNSLDLFFSAQFNPKDRDEVMMLWLDCFAKADRAQISDHCEHHYYLSQCFIDEVNNRNLEVIRYWDVQEDGSITV